MAVSSFYQASLGASLIHLRAAVWARAGEGKEFCRVAAGRGQGGKLRSCVPTARRRASCVVVQPLIAEEDEELILEDRAPGRTTPIVKAGVIAHVSAAAAARARITVVLRKCVQTRAVGFEKETAVILIRTVLSNDLNLGAAITPVFRIVVVRNNFDFLDGIFVRCDDGSATPGNAGCAHAVNLVIIFAGAGSIRADLSSIFNLKDP